MKTSQATARSPHRAPGGREDQTGERILAAAEEVFGRKGFKAATTREIAAAAGVNIALIHYYHGSKERLWQEVVARVLTRIRELTQGLLEIPAGDLESGIRSIVGSLVDIFADHPGYARLLQHRSLDEVGAESAEELVRPIMDVGLAFIERNRIQGFAEDFDPALVLFGLQGALRIFFQEKDSVRVLFGEDPASFTPEFRQKLKDLISSLALHLAGLHPGGGPKQRKGRKRRTT